MRIGKGSLRSVDLGLGSPIGVYTGEVQITDDERAHLTETSLPLWELIKHKCPAAEGFTGAGRFDYVPEFVDINDDPKGAFEGTMQIRGVYEVNLHSPECTAAASAMRAFLPELRSACVDVAALVADAIKETYGAQQDVAMVTGSNGRAKQAWKDVYAHDLARAGLRLSQQTPEEAMRLNPGLVYRWGDARRGNGCVSHYDDAFVDWLYARPSESVFNTVFERQRDPSRKDLLLGAEDPNLARILGNNRPLKSEDDIEWSTQVVEGASRHARLVLKPDGGASGADIVFGEDLSLQAWERLLREKVVEPGYSLWELKWLPRIVTRDGAELALDINPTFWIEGGKIVRLLHVIARLDPWTTYRHRKTINVAQGAGFAPLFV